MNPTLNFSPSHTHKDQFTIAYSDYTKPSAQNADMVSYIAPSLTPTSGHPSFRSYTVDPVTFAILDFTQYYANMSSPNYQTAGPEWAKLYSAKETYGSQLNPPVTEPAAELTPAFWHNVTTIFESNDSLFQTYYSLQSRGYNNSTCTGDCKSQEICGLRASQSQYNCVVPTPGVTDGLRKRDLNMEPGGRLVVSEAKGYMPGGDCEGGRMARIFRSLVSRDSGENSRLLVRELGKRIGNGGSLEARRALGRIEKALK